ncbi:MAG: hypothetical protein M3256_17405 [Actinomycetota bacterium]|nr:hypothetical protein [Actinomycetota bacterium]
MSTEHGFETTERREVDVRDGAAELPGNLIVPTGAAAVVVVAGDRAHDAQLGRLTRDLQEAHVATLLLHLETAEEVRSEEISDEVDADVGRPARRLLDAVRLLGQLPSTAGLPVGILALGDIVPAAIEAAAEDGGVIQAIVGHDGQPRARQALDRVRAVTLLLVDYEGQQGAAEAALQDLAADKSVRTVHAAQQGAEARTEALVSAAVSWFRLHLARR